MTKHHPTYPYRVTLSRADNANLERAAAKVGISPQRYLHALFTDLVPAKIGKVKMFVGGGSGEASCGRDGGLKKNDTRDGMGWLVGKVQIARESKAIAQDLDNEKVAAQESEMEKLSPPHRWAYKHLCQMSKGEAIETSQTLLMQELDLSQPRVSALVKTLVKAGLIKWEGARGPKKSVLVAPYDGCHQ